MKKTRRSMQVADVIRESLAIIFMRDIADPDLALVSVTDVELTTDLREARVFVSVIGDDARRDRVMAALDRCRGRIRRQLASRAKLRRTPTLEFRLDTTAERAMKIESILREVRPVTDTNEGDGHDD